MKSLCRIQLFATLWTIAYQAPRFMGFSRQGYWSGLPFPSPGDLPDPGIEPRSPTLQADALASEPPGRELFFIFWDHRYNFLSSFCRSKKHQLKLKQQRQYIRQFLDLNISWNFVNTTINTRQQYFVLALSTFLKLVFSWSVYLKDSTKKTEYVPCVWTQPSEDLDVG